MSGAVEGEGETHASELWCCELTVSCCSLRVGGETPALLGLRLAINMFAMKQQDPDLGEQGESKVSLPTAPHGWRQGWQGVQRGAKSGGRGRQKLPNHPRVPPLLSRQGPGWAVGTRWDPLPAMLPSPPCVPSPSVPRPRRGAHSQRHFLSPLQPACCVAGQRLTPISAGPKE